MLTGYFSTIFNARVFWRLKDFVSKVASHVRSPKNLRPVFRWGLAKPSSYNITCSPHHVTNKYGAPFPLRLLIHHPFRAMAYYSWNFESWGQHQRKVSESPQQLLRLFSYFGFVFCAPIIKIEIRDVKKNISIEVVSDCYYDPLSLSRTMPSGPPDNGAKVLGRGLWNHEVHWVAASGRNW